MLTAAELHEIKMRLRFVVDTLVSIREGIPADEGIVIALAVRGIEADVMNLAASIKPDAA